MPSHSLITIAKLAGVSRSTVSRVINDHPNVSDEVRERVLKIIADTGYQPNLSARSLRSQRTNVIGLVLPQTMGTLFSDPYFPVITQGVAKACNAYEKTLALFIEDSDQNIMQRISQEGFLDGFIYQSVDIDDQLYKGLLNKNIPFISIGRPGITDGVTYIDVDNVNGAVEAVNHLISLDYQRIATLAGNLNSSAGLDRLAGYKKALLQAGFSIDEKLIRSGNFEEQKAYEATFDLMNEKMDAVFAASDLMARGAIRAIQEVGLKVPEDIAIVGYDDLQPATASHPMLTTIRQPAFEFGEEAIRMLINKINQGETYQEVKIMETELVIRDSCGAKSRHLKKEVV